MTLILRKAREDDKKLLFEWANDPATRENSFSTSQIPWPVHEKWFEDRIRSNNTRIYVAQDELGHDVGQIRFEKNQDYALAGMSIAEAFRGRGLGSELLDRGCEAIFAEWPDIAFVRGRVKRVNRHSSRIFLKTGFEEEGREGDAIVYRRLRG